MSASRNPDGPGVGTEFSSKIERDEPMQTGGHKPGKMVGNDALPESHIEVLPPGSAPPSKTFEPNTNAIDKPTSTPTSTPQLVGDALADASEQSTGIQSNVTSGTTSASTTAETIQPELKPDDAISGDKSTRSGTNEAFGVSQSAPSTEPASTSASAALSASKQDSILSATDVSRPGASEAAPAGVSQPSSSLSENVKSSLDKLSEAAPTSQSITDGLPTPSQAADAVKTAAASIVSGVQSLALGANDAVAENASASRTEGLQHRSTDELHVPGEYKSKTTDAEDQSAIQRGLQSVESTLPSTQEVKQSAQSVQDSLPATEDVKNSLQSAQSSVPSVEDMKNKLPDAEAVKSSLPDLESAKRSLPSTDAISKQTPIIGSNDSGSIVERVQEAAASAQAQAYQALDSVKQQLPGQPTVSKNEQTDTIEDHHTTAYSGTSQLAGTIPFEPSAVPRVVTDSQQLALASPEATANPEAVQEKQEVERELQQGVSLQAVNKGE